MWNRYRQTADFKDGQPWLLRFFDQIRFYPVSESELLKLRKDFIAGRFKLRTEETVLSLKQYHTFLQQHAASIDVFKARQQAAFEAERQRWQANNLTHYVSEDTLDEADTQCELDLPEGAQAISSQVTGTVWKLLVTEGEHVEAGKPVIMIESMKMEFSVDSSVTGTVRQLFCKQGGYVSAGQVLLIIQEQE
jgi:urea carboxylase